VSTELVCSPRDIFGRIGGFLGYAFEDENAIFAVDLSMKPGGKAVFRP